MSAVRRLVVFVCALMICASTVAVAYDLPRSRRVKYNFNPGWKVFVGDPSGAEAIDFDDSLWKEVTTPYAWNEDDAFKKDIKDLSTGVAWYRKRFKVSAESAGKKVFLEFEGIRHGGEFYLNGKFIGRHENGVMAFGFDITDLVKPAPRRTFSRFGSTIRGTTKRRPPAQPTSGMIGISMPTTAASTRTSSSTSPTGSSRRCRSTSTWAPRASMFTRRTSTSRAGARSWLSNRR